MKKDIVAKAEIVLKTPLDVVWKAVTDPAEVKKYFFNTDLVTDWKVGSPIFFRGEWEGQAYEDKGTVLKYEPKNMLQYDYWSSFSGKEDIPQNYQTITYALTPKGSDTLLTITQANVPSEESREHSEQNWSMVLNELKKLVENSGR